MRAAPLLLSVSLASAALAALPAAASGKSPAAPYDFNGDGRKDLVVPGPGAVKKGEHKTGVISVLYGGSGRKQSLSVNSPGVAGLFPHGSRWGESAASADFDRDGYADLAVSGRSEPGVTVVYGSKKGLSRRTAALRLRPAAPGGDPGVGLAAGRFDGDRDPDLAVVHDEALWVFPDVRTGRSTPKKTVFSSEEGFTAAIPAAADYNGDGRTDLVVTNRSRRGSSFAYLVGTASGLADPLYYRVSETTIDAAEPGDFNGDGHADLALAVADKVQVRYGEPGGLYSLDMFTRFTKGMPGKQTWGRPLALSSGDVNRDGRDDLAVGAGNAGQKDRGAVTLLYGARSRLSTKGAQLFNHTTKALKAVPRPYDRFGSAVALVDLTGDGRAELAVGAPRRDHNDGRLYLLPNSRGRLTAQGTGNHGPADFALKPGRLFAGLLL